MADERREWLLLRIGLALAVAVAVGQVAAARLAEEPTVSERTRRCLEVERGLTTREARDPIAQSAGGGAFATTVEGNELSISFPTDDQDAERIIRLYHQVAGPLVGQLERRASAIYLWARPATATQLQTTYDCAY